MKVLELIVAHPCEVCTIFIGVAIAIAIIRGEKIVEIG